MRRVVLLVAQVGRDDELTHAAFGHANQPLLDGRDDAALTKLETQKHVVLRIQLFQLLSL